MKTRHSSRALAFAKCASANADARASASDPSLRARATARDMFARALFSKRLQMTMTSIGNAHVIERSFARALEGMRAGKKRASARFGRRWVTTRSDSQTSRWRGITRARSWTPRETSQGMKKTHVENLNAATARELKHWSAATEATRRERHELKVFCNRSLNMSKIACIGFDMDYTLAMYDPATFEQMSYEETVKKLIGAYGYPKAVLEAFTFDPYYMVRGLVVDKKRGNILKMDRHSYVKVAYHGFEALSTDDRLKTYCDVTKRPSYDGQEFSALDTLFSMGEAYLFSQLVEAKDSGKHPFLNEKDYMKMYDEIRAAVDLCHRDGSLKHAVAANPSKFMDSGAEIVPLLKALRASGKKLFLLTNSLWDYTNVVMNYLCMNKVGNDKTLEWLELFDVVVTGACKPAYFANESATIYEVDTKTHLLRNTDNGAPLTPIGAVEDQTHLEALASGMRATGVGAAKVYQGGSYLHLHAMLDIDVGSKLLYVGDHIYGDIVRSKKTIGWRTMLIVPELAHEIEVLEANKEKPHVLRRLRTLRDALDDQVARHSWLVQNSSVETSAADKAKIMAELDRARDMSRTARQAHREGMREYHKEFHYVWGQMMKAGSQSSRFASQLERYACLYTSHVRNMFGYSPEKVFRATEDIAPHDERDEEFARAIDLYAEAIESGDIEKLC